MSASDFRKAQNAALVDKVKEIRAIHPLWSYDRAFAFALEQHPELSQVTASGFAKTQCSPSRLAQAADANSEADTDFQDQGGFRNSLEQLRRMLEDSASPNISLIPSRHRKLIGAIMRLMSLHPNWSQSDALAEVMRTNPELGQKEDGAAAARQVAAVNRYGDDPYRTDPFYHQP